ncbi:MAG: type II toxin-antitoxin system prevent-host-death family antitoxin [Gaiellaceae bacterium]
MRMGIRELRDNLTSAVRRVRAGETIEVTHDGEPVALLTPIPKGKLERLAAEGVVTLPERPLVLPEPLKPGRVRVSEALDEVREDRI